VSQVEVITGEVRRLVLRCRTLEAQLQQSVPKKTHEETVSKMQEKIDGLSTDLNAAKEELQRTAVISTKLESIESKIASQNEIFGTYGPKIDQISSKVADNITKEAYSQALSKNADLEERVRSMVERAAYDSLQAKVNELNTQISSMVPETKYNALEAELAQNFVPKSRYQELERAFSETVPRKDYEAARARVAELEEKMNKIISVTEALFSSATGASETSHESSEIREVQSNLSEIHSAAETSTPTDAPAPVSSPEPVTETPVIKASAQAEPQTQQG
jgi:ribosomal protein S16